MVTGDAGDAGSGSPRLDPNEGERGTWEERVGGSGRVGWRLGLRGDKERSGVGRLGLWPVGPARSGGGGQLGHLAQRGGGVCCFCFVLFSFHLFLFIYFPFCFIQFKIFMHFLKMCLLHHNYLCNI